jgi:hypothetical protein
MRLAGYSRLLKLANPASGAYFVKQGQASSVGRRSEALDELRQDINRLRIGRDDVPAVRTLLTSPPNGAYTTLYPEPTLASLASLTLCVTIPTIKATLIWLAYQIG